MKNKLKFSEWLKDKKVKLIDKFDSIYEFIHDNHLRAVMIGDSAVANYLAKGKPQKLDFLVSDMATVKKLLQQENIKHETNPPNINVQKWNVNLIDADTGNDSMNAYILDTATTRLIGNKLFSIIEPHVLAITKYDNARTKDRQVAFKLIEKKGLLNKSSWNKHLDAMENMVADYKSLKNIGNLIK